MNNDLYMTKAELHQYADLIQSNINKIIDVDNIDDLEFMLTAICKMLEKICNSKKNEIFLIKMVEGFNN